MDSQHNPFWHSRLIIFYYGALIEIPESDVLVFWIGTNVLHKYVHLGDFNNGDNYKYPYTEEEGILFEVTVYGQNVHDYNAIEILNKN